MILMVSRLFYVCCLFYDNVQLTLHCPSHVPHFKGVLLCSFTKSWFCFGGVLEHALKSNQIKSLLLSHHHSTSALVSEILMSVLQTVQKNKKNTYIWTVHIYRLYRRQCAKYTYIYSVHIVYYKDILNYQLHIIHRMGTSTLCTLSIHYVVYT